MSKNTKFSTQSAKRHPICATHLLQNIKVARHYAIKSNIVAWGRNKPIFWIVYKSRYQFDVKVQYTDHWYIVSVTINIKKL